MLAAEALAQARSWLAGADEVVWRGVNVGELVRTGVLRLFRDALLAGRMSAALLDVAAPRVLRVAGGDIASGVVRWEAERRGVRVTEEEAPREGPRGARSVGGGALGPSGRRLGALVDEVGAWLPWRERAGRGVAGRPPIVFAGGGVDYLNQRPLVERLRRLRPLRPVVHVGLHPPAMAGRDHAGAGAGLPRPERVLARYGGPREALELGALGRRAWSTFEREGFPGADRLPQLLANPWLKPRLRRLCVDTLPRAGGALGAARRLLGGLEPAVLVLNNASSPRERALALAAAERGVPTLQLVHSGFNDLDVHAVEGRRLWVWGEAHRRQFEPLVGTGTRVEVVGNPASPGRATGGPGGGGRGGVGGGPDVVFLLMTAAQPGLLFTFVDPDGHRADLEALAAAIAETPGARLVIKPHPRYDELELYHALAARWPNVSLTEDRGLGELLGECDVAVALNFGTTAAIEAIVAGCPLLWVRASSYYPAGFDLMAPGARVVASRDEIRPAVRQLAESPEARATLAARARGYAGELSAVPPAVGSVGEGGGPDRGAGGAVARHVAEAIARVADGLEPFG
jgi:hypothetical protein